MNIETSVEKLLAWQLVQEAADAPPAPRARRLLELSRPWWKKFPQQFGMVLIQLDAVHAQYGHAMVDDERGKGYPIPTVVARKNVELKSLANLHYFDVDRGRLRIRFRLTPAFDPIEQEVEVTFVATGEPRALFEVRAALAPGGEFRIDAELPEELETAWAQLKVTDRMPFRFIIRGNT